MDRVEMGKEELQKLYETAKGGSYGAYLIAGHAAEWLKKNARACYASATPFWDVFSFIETRMDELHEKYHGITFADDGRASLVRAAREVFTAKHKTKAAEIAGIEGKSVDGIVEWYCNFLLHVCEVKVWAIHPPSNSKHELLEMPHQRLRLSVQDRVATIEDAQSNIVYTEPRIQRGEIMRAVDRMKAVDA
jgi:hypothetical protein